MQQLERMASEAGRQIPVSIFAMPPEASWAKRFEEAGAKRGILLLPAASSEDTLRRLDKYAELVTYEF
jgi:hypothetical protein